MKKIRHSERLRALSTLIKPIAAALDSGGATLPKTGGDRALHPESQLDSDLDESFSSLPQDSSGFFSSSVYSEALVPPEPPEPQTASLDGKQPGRLFEYLRQSVLQSSAKEFSQLPLHLQAIARMGGLLYTERLNFQPRVYHLLANGVLLGVLDRKKSRFYVRKRIEDVDLTDLHAVMRPNTVAKPGNDMELMPIHDAVWQYGMHDPEALLDLPTEMGTHFLHLRKLPRVSPGLLLDRHMVLIRRLLVREHQFDQLLRSTSKNNRTNLLRDLASLLLTRSIECLPPDASGLHANRPHKTPAVNR